MALLAARLGYEPVPLKADAPMMRVFERGKRIEDEYLESHRYICERQQEIYLDVTGRLKVVGHIDGFARDSFQGHVVEIKSQNRVAWDEFERSHWDSGLFPKYKWQVSCYMIAYDAPLKLVRVLVDDEGRAVEEHVSYVDEPFYSLADIRSRILRVEAAAATGVLSAECTPAFPCPYFYLHEEIDRELIDDETIDVLAHEYEDARAASAAARGKQDAARRALREASEQDKYETASGVRVTFYMAKNPPKVDRESLDEFLKENGRKFDEFTTQGQSERLRVTLPKEDDESTSSVSETGTDSGVRSAGSGEVIHLVESGGMDS